MGLLQRPQKASEGQGQGSGDPGTGAFSLVGEAVSWPLVGRDKSKVGIESSGNL